MPSHECISDYKYFPFVKSFSWYFWNILMLKHAAVVLLLRFEHMTYSKLVTGFCFFLHFSF